MTSYYTKSPAVMVSKKKSITARLFLCPYQIGFLYEKSLPDISQDLKNTIQIV